MAGTNVRTGNSWQYQGLVRVPAPKSQEHL